MKKLLIPLLFAVVISACNKAGKSENTNDDPIPTASFKINNMVADNTVLEGTDIEFENNSQCADSYEWNFGDGTISTERTPVGIRYRQCPGVREIRLLVRTRRGRIATIIRTINVRCR